MPRAAFAARIDRRREPRNRARVARDARRDRRLDAVAVRDHPGRQPAAAGRVASRTLLDGWRGSLSLLTPDENLGFAGGNELGVEHASGDLICFLNPDLVVDAGMARTAGGGARRPSSGRSQRRSCSIPTARCRRPARSCVTTGGRVRSEGRTCSPATVRSSSLGMPTTRRPRAGSFAATSTSPVAGSTAAITRRSTRTSTTPCGSKPDGQVTRVVSDRPVTHYHGMGGADAHHEIASRSFEMFRRIWASRTHATAPTSGRRDGRPAEPRSDVRRERWPTSIAAAGRCAVRPRSSGRGRRRWQRPATA